MSPQVCPFGAAIDLVECVILLGCWTVVLEMPGRVCAFVQTAVVMLKYVSQHNITIVTASNRLDYDREDIAMFDFMLSAEDIRDLDRIQAGRVRTCSDCWKDSCRACQAALKAAGCTPWGGPSCETCAAKHLAKIMPVCKDEPMVCMYQQLKSCSSTAHEPL